MKFFNLTLLGAAGVALLTGAAACSDSDTETGTTTTATTTSGAGGAGGAAGVGGAATTSTGGAGGGQCAPLPEDPAAPNNWNYNSGDPLLGPEGWGSIKNDKDMPAYPQCGDTMLQQAPIAFPSPAMPWATGGVKFDSMNLSWSNAAVATGTKNSGQTWYTYIDSTKSASTVKYMGEDYSVAQFHFHAPSEHTIDGKHYPLEVHFVHTGGNKFLGVAVGLMFEEAANDNPVLAKLWDKFSECPTADAVDLPANTTLDLKSLLPADLAHFEYDGGLTAPPCSHTVHFAIMTTPIKASAAQIKKFADALGPTNRPTQKVLDQMDVTYEANK